MADFNRHQVGGETRIKNPLEPEATQGCDNPTGNRSSRLQIEFLTQGNLRGRMNLGYHGFIGVGKQAPDLVQIVLFVQGPNRTGQNALPAPNAWRFAKTAGKRACNPGLAAPIYETERLDQLDVPADVDAPAAQNAFVRIERNRRMGSIWNETFFGLLLEIAGSYSGAGG